MSLDIKFAYVCRAKFTDLPGESNEIRHCNQCDLDVTNLDALGDEAAMKLLQDASEKKHRICISATVQLQDSLQCPGSSLIIPTAGDPLPASKAVIDVTAPSVITADQIALLMKTLELPDRLAVVRMFKESATVRLGAYWNWKLEEHITDPLDRVGLKWTLTEISSSEDGYWELDVKRPSE